MGSANRLGLKEQLRANDDAFERTGHLFGLEPLTRKEGDDLIVHPISGAQSIGGPIERDPKSVEDDLNTGWVRPRVAADIHGVVARPEGSQWTVDEAVTAGRGAEMRAELRKLWNLPEDFHF